MSSKNTSNFLEKYFSEHSNYAVGPVPHIEIEESEQKLQVKFSDSYEKFVSLYGGALLSENSIYGLRKEEMMGDDNWSVTQLTLYYRNQNWPGLRIGTLFPMMDQEILSALIPRVRSGYPIMIRGRLSK